MILEPPTPQGGLLNIQYINKSPLGDLGVNQEKLTFSTPTIRKGGRIQC